MSRVQMQTAPFGSGKLKMKLMKTARRDRERKRRKLIDLALRAITDLSNHYGETNNPKRFKANGAWMTIDDLR